MRKTLVSASIFSVFLFAAIAVYSFSSADETGAFTPINFCDSIYGVAKPVNVAVQGEAGTVPNSGIVYFDEGIKVPELNFQDSVPYPDYRACIIDTGAKADPNATRYVLEGWAVDSNLGWISFNCKDGLNRGRPCSEQKVDYRVEISEKGKFSGFAYSDNAGWISFGCEGGVNTMDGKTYSCGSTDYAVGANESAKPTVYPDGSIFVTNYYPLISSYTHAWSDNVGWFNLDGMMLPLDKFINKPQCIDGIDNDGDGRIDYPDDKECSSPGYFSEGDPRECADGKDNDGDGRIDMQDRDCTSPADNTEKPRFQTECADGKDNDGDGIADGVDTNGNGKIDDFELEAGCHSPNDNAETNKECNDNKDNDGDGKVDFDGVDLNGDGDFDDPGEFAPDPHCYTPDDNDESGDALPACSDGIDNDGDGKTDTADPSCCAVGFNSEVATVECWDAKDNDGDGKVDYPSDSACTFTCDNDEDDDVEPQCKDGIDNDEDGIADGVDANKNGKIDLWELEPGCTSFDDNDEIDKQCNDKKDNDGNGYADYLGITVNSDNDYSDSGEKAPDYYACKSTEDDDESVPECSDGKDNDGDGKIDWNGIWNGATQVAAKDTDCADDPYGVSECSDPLNCIGDGHSGMSLSIKPDPYSSPVVADGAGKYVFELNLAASDGTPYGPGYTFDGKAKPELDDFVDLFLSERQLSDGGVVPSLALSDLNFQDFTYNSAKKKWVATVASPVPTSGMSGVDFLVKPKSFYGKLVGDPNKFNLELISFNEIKNAAGELQPGSCALASTPEAKAACGIVPKENKTGKAPTAINFKPIASIKKLLADGETFIRAVSGVENDVSFQIEYNGDAAASVKKDDVSLKLFASAYEAGTSSNDTGGHTFVYHWTDYIGEPSNVTNTDIATNADDSVYTNQISPLLDTLLHFGATPYLKAEKESGEYVGKPSIVALFEYVWNGKTINYFAKSLPDTQSEGIYNPVVDIEGLIYSKVVVNPQNPDDFYSTGNLTSNVTRDIVTSNIAGILGSKVQFVSDATSPLVILQDGNGTDCINYSGTVVLDDVNGSKFLYIKNQDVVFSSVAGDINCAGKQENIVIADGGDVFIDSNLYNADKNAPKWSIVALRGGAGANQYGGNVYIDTNVTNVHANIVADGSLIGYKAELGRADNLFDSDGYPIEPLTEEDNKKQIFIWGSAATWNTIGGSLPDKHKDTQGNNVYVLPSGRFTQDQQAARKGDLNFFRAFKLYLERCSDPSKPSFKLPIDQQCIADNGVSADTQCDALPDPKPSCYKIDSSKSYANGGDLIDKDEGGASLRAKGFGNNANIDSDKPVVIRFSPPKPDNPIFKSKKSGGAELKNF